MFTDFQNIYKRYTDCKTVRNKAKPLWDDISKFVGIQTQPDYAINNNQNSDSQLDQFVDDPSSAISVNQFGDYLVGIMWGTGDKILNIIPSDYVNDLADPAQTADWFAYATKRFLYHINHEDAGYTSALRPYAYDQGAFGCSGIGIFPNPAFAKKTADNALIARNYGIDNVSIDEGKSGVPEIVFANYHWTVNRIVGEFCSEDGGINPKLVAKLPSPIKKAWDSKDYNAKFDIVFGTFPREDFNPKLKGMRGTRYRGVWFMEAGQTANSTNAIFFEESFSERPIAVARAIRIRNEVFGRGSGTMLLSTIRSLNFIVAEVIEIIEKMGNPSLGVWNNAIFGDSVLDTSPNGLTVFNQALLGGDGKPSFPLYDVGDPSKIIQFLIPYLNEKITTAFKIDALLDFNSAKDMTATESLQRYAIRGKSLSGILLQQKNELLVPNCKRGISILMELGELGVNPRTMKAAADKLKRNARTVNRIIPDEVLQVMADGRPWYELKFNNELEKLTRTEAVQNLLQLINAITAIAALYPAIVDAVDWYALLQDINDNLDPNNQILCGADKFKKMVAAKAQQAQAAMALQAGQAGAGIQKDQSTAGLNAAKAQQAQNGSI